MRKTQSISSVRASRDGHQFHEAWLARKSLGLLLQLDELKAIAVEGLSPSDEQNHANVTVEVADATFFCGGASFSTAASVEITQFKYSVADAQRPFVASDAKATLQKFAAADADHKITYGEVATLEKLRFCLITNRPIASDLREAIRSARENLQPGTTTILRQLKQISDALGLTGDALNTFCSRLTVVGTNQPLASLEDDNFRIIANWSASSDILAEARIGKLRKLIRDKAGMAGNLGNNLIKTVDVLEALLIHHEQDLLPAPAAFSSIGHVVETRHIKEFSRQLNANRRWIVRAPAGTGKTVFAEGLAKHLSKFNVVILFDCFGGGAYRNFSDGRHRCDRGLLHIVNELACKGLCDPVLPGTSDQAELVRRCLERLRQAVAAIKCRAQDSRLIIIIDAADNAGLEAKDRGDIAFPQILLKEISDDAAFDGIHIVATTRPERVDLAHGDANCEPYDLTAFTRRETGAFVHAKRPEATLPQIDILHRRAAGNPRVLTHLVDSSHALPDGNAEAEPIAVEELIEQRIASSRSDAVLRGIPGEKIDTFLCAMAHLPPPSPSPEMSIAFGVPAAEIESLVTELFPLLDRTPLGIIFRDEPTETLVRRIFGARAELLAHVVRHMQAAQSTSHYAARALPGFLAALNKDEELFQLAFDTRFPTSLTSEVARRSIRHHRLRAALRVAVQSASTEKIVPLLVELASVTSVEERGEQYLLAHPDLAVAAGDAEVLRRMFDIRTAWPGKRHARLAITNIVGGDLIEARLHTIRADEWWAKLSEAHPASGLERPAALDDAVIPIYCLAKGLLAEADHYINCWESQNYSFEVGVAAFETFRFTDLQGRTAQQSKLARDLAAVENAAPITLAAALTVLDIDDAKVEIELIARLAASVANQDFPKDPHHFDRRNNYRAVVIRSASRAFALGLSKESHDLTAFAKPNRYGYWALRDAFHVKEILSWVLWVAANAASEQRAPRLCDSLPEELYRLIANDTLPDDDKLQHALLEKRLSEDAKAESDVAHGAQARTLSAAERHDAPNRIRSRILPLLRAIRSTYSVIAATDADARHLAMNGFFASWMADLDDGGHSYDPQARRRFVDALYRDVVLQLLPGLRLGHPDYSSAVIKWMEAAPYISTSHATEFVAHFAQFELCQADAGRMATLIVKAIESEQDTTQRADQFAKLSRAIMLANKSEAKCLFARGLEELDALGSGDSELLSGILNYAAALPVGPMPSEQALRLAKICEIVLGQYEQEKFPWPLTAHAFAKVWGLPYLAQIARWQDRDKADLAFSLPAALSHLVRAKHLPPTLAVALLRLVEPVQLWDWRWSHLFEALIEQKPDDLPAILSETLAQLRDTYPSGVSRETLNEIKKVTASASEAIRSFGNEIEALAEKPPEPANSRYYASDWAAWQTSEEEVARAKQIEERKRALESQADPLSTASVEQLIAGLDDLEAKPDEKSAIFKRLRERIKYADQSQHIEAMLGARNIEVYVKINALQEIKAEWFSRSPSGLPALNGCGERLASLHADYLLTKDWGCYRTLKDIEELSGTSVSLMCKALCRAAVERNIQPSATTWLELARLLSKETPPDISRQSLERFLASPASRIADLQGDGLWSPSLDPGRDPTKVAAGLIWFCLGSPNAADRWRAAHTVRALARLNLWDVIDALFDRLKDGSAGAFVDKHLPFYSMHAKQWLLLVVARLAMTYPAQIRRHADALKEIAFHAALPHVGFQAAARRALLFSYEGDASQPASALRSQLAELLTSPFDVKQERFGTEAGFQWNRPESQKKPEDQFDLEYEFNKHEVSNLGHLFGLANWQVDDRITHCVRRWDASSKSMWDKGGRSDRRDYDDYRINQDRTHTYGRYLAWHALATVAGELLRERPLIIDEYASRSWDEFIASYGPTRTDNLWLADGTDQTPSNVSVRLLSKSDGKKPEFVSDTSILGQLVGVDVGSGKVANLLVNGTWECSGDVNVTVRSVLIPPRFARRAALATATAPLSQSWLPSLEPYQDEDGSRRFKHHFEPCEPWIVERSPHLQLDQYDPYGAATATERPQPSRVIIKRFGLEPCDPWGSRWRSTEFSEAFASSAWGHHQSEDDPECGLTLRIGDDFLRTMLDTLDRSLILLVKLSHYLDRRRYGSFDEAEDSFIKRAFVVLIDKTLAVEVVDPGQEANTLVASLAPHDRFDFESRFRVLARVGSSRKAKGPSSSSRKRKKV